MKRRFAKLAIARAMRTGLAKKTAMTMAYLPAFTDRSEICSIAGDALGRHAAAGQMLGRSGLLAACILLQSISALIASKFRKPAALPSAKGKVYERYMSKSAPPA